MSELINLYPAFTIQSPPLSGLNDSIDSFFFLSVVTSTTELIANTKLLSIILFGYEVMVQVLYATELLASTIVGNKLPESCLVYGGLSLSNVCKGKLHVLLSYMWYSTIM